MEHSDPDDWVMGRIRETMGLSTQPQGSFHTTVLGTQ